MIKSLCVTNTLDYQDTNFEQFDILLYAVSIPVTSELITV
jgi:hypothetical protein